MTDGVHGVWVPAAGVIGALIGGFFRWLVERSTQLRLANLEKEIRDLRERELECRVANAMLKSQLDALHDRLAPRKDKQ